MTFVVTEQCIKCRFTDCVIPCPVECFHEGPEFMVIDPEVCIDCNACATECPVGAIYQDKDLPADQMVFKDINRRLSKIYPQVLEKTNALEEADKWRDVMGKIHYLNASLDDLNSEISA